jgi:hypothetical protein
MLQWFEFQFAKKTKRWEEQEKGKQHTHNFNLQKKNPRDGKNKKRASNTHINMGWG